MSEQNQDGQERDRKRQRLSPPSPNNSSDRSEGEDPKNSGENESGQGKKVLVSLTPEVYEDMLETFECPICNISMYDGPILQCPEGHIICQTCKDKLPRSKQCPQCRKKIGTSRNRALEGMAVKMPMPCNNTKFGCQLIVSPSARISHAEECRFAPLRCPTGYFDDEKSCLWEGNLRDLDKHWKAEHKGNVHEYTDSVERTRTISLAIGRETFSESSRWFSLAAVGDLRFYLASFLNRIACTCVFCILKSKKRLVTARLAWC
eukprot:188424_1